MLEARGIRLMLGRAEVLHGVDFTAAAGELTAIVGPNGSGKTSLLRAMTGDVPFEGRVALNGRDITGLAAWELSAVRGVLPQAAVLSFPFQVIEVVNIGLHRGVAGAESTLALQALARVGLEGYAERFFQELSGGEQQRVHLARVLAQVWQPVLDGVPRWLFLDEPVSALDIAHQLEVMQIARDFADAGGGVVTVMHDLNLTAMFADRITVLARGSVVATGAPDAVITDTVLSQAYGCAVRTNRAPDPESAARWLLPHMAALHEETG